MLFAGNTRYHSGLRCVLAAWLHGTKWHDAAEMLEAELRVEIYAR